MSLFAATALYNYQPTIVTPSGLNYNYLSGSTIIFDFGNPASYPGSGSVVYNVGSGSSLNSGSLINSPVFSSTNGGIMNFSRASSQYMTYQAATSASFSSIAIIKFKTSGSTFSFYDGFPEIPSANGIIYSTVPNTTPSPKCIYFLYNSAGSPVNLGEYFITTGAQANWHAYSQATNGSNSHIAYFDTGSKITSTTSITRASTGVVTNYYGREILNNHYTDSYLMAYLQYPGQLTATQISASIAIFQDRYTL